MNEERDAERKEKRERMGVMDPERTRPVFYGDQRPSASFDPNNIDIEPWMDKEYIENMMKGHY